MTTSSLAMKISLVFVFLIVALLIIAMFTNAYYVTDGAGAIAFSKGDETYLFLGTSRSGYHFRYIDYPLVAFREYFNAPISPADGHVSSTVIRVSPSVVQRYQLDYGKDAAGAPEFITPFDDGFYAMCTGLSLCKWAGDHFEPATQEERRTLEGINRLFHGDVNNQVINGWSVREVRRSPGDHFEVEIADQYAIRARNYAADVRQYPSISVELQRSGKPAETLYDVNGAPRRVSKLQYEKFFGRF
jgi:hypothetical protein